MYNCWQMIIIDGYIEIVTKKHIVCKLFVLDKNTRKMYNLVQIVIP